MQRYEKGDKAYIIENNRIITPVTIIGIHGDLYTCGIPSGGAIRLKRSRLYETEEDARPHILVEKTKYRSPYDYM